MKKMLVLLMTVTFVSSCRIQKDSLQNADKEMHYVTPEYAQRFDGYDWSVVSILNSGSDSASVRVRSRADRKKPSCTFSGVGKYNKKRDTVAVIFQSLPIYFHTDENVLTISSPSDETLHYFCSGGATLARTYYRLKEPLDTLQLK